MDKTMIMTEKFERERDKTTRVLDTLMKICNYKEGTLGHSRIQSCDANDNPHNCVNYCFWTMREENKKLKKENKINKQVIKILNKKAEELKKAKDKVNIEDMFNIWRELQMEMNPQYSIDDEVNFLLHRHPKWYPLAKEVFEDLYPAEFILDIETKTYREWTEEDE